MATYPGSYTVVTYTGNLPWTLFFWKDFCSIYVEFSLFKVAVKPHTVLQYLYGTKNDSFAKSNVNWEKGSLKY